ncbi:xylanase [gut metagenome]|uniref:Xylanase n=1 Tax=gut metagenome TaxID=749906 RepID=J9GDL0_9ZZZZ
MKIVLTLIFWLAGTFAFSQNPSSEHALQMDSAAMIRIGCTYLGTPYVAHTLDLEEEGEEHLIVNTQEVDCILFVEYSLAEALGGSFNKNLQRIRYRDGIIHGYTSRLHYTSDWIENGIRGGFLTDVTAIHSPHTQTLNLSFMSTHPQRYKKLAHSPENVAQMAECEQRLTGKVIHWLPEDDLPDSGLPWIHDGDILAITTQVNGLDIAHVGIALYRQGKLHLLHASSSLKEVVISQTTLHQMLKKNKSWTGIRVVRMSHSKQ